MSYLCKRDYGTAVRHDYGRTLGRPAAKGQAVRVGQSMTKSQPKNASGSKKATGRTIKTADNSLTI